MQTNTNPSEFRLVIAIGMKQRVVLEVHWSARAEKTPAVALSHPDRPRLLTAATVRMGRCSWSLTRPEREART